MSLSTLRYGRNESTSARSSLENSFSSRSSNLRILPIVANLASWSLGSTEYTLLTLRMVDESQTEIPDEVAFTFKLKGYEGPAGCNGLNQPKLRKCWELETPLPVNIM